MDAGIIKFIEKQRDYIYSHYDLPDEERQKAEAMFERIGEFGAGCRNMKDFEDKFYNRTMSQEFYRMLLDFMIYMKPTDDAPTTAQVAKEPVVKPAVSPAVPRTTDITPRPATATPPAGKGHGIGRVIVNLLHGLSGRKAQSKNSHRK